MKETHGIAEPYSLEIAEYWQINSYGHELLLDSQKHEVCPLGVCMDLSAELGSQHVNIETYPVDAESF